MLPDFSKNFANESQPTISGGNKNMTQQEKEEKAAPQGQPIKKVDIRYILAVLFLTASIIAVGAMFGINAYFDREITSIEGGIGTLEEAIKTNDILNLAMFDKRTQILKDLTTSRAGYSIILSEASRLVIPGVHYSSVSITSDADNSYSLIIRGIADSLTQYHQQIQRIEATEGMLAGGSFDGYSLQQSETGNTTVLFTVSFDIPLKEINDLLNSTS